MTIFDAYPKATFHFLILPRVKDKTGPWSAANLISLKKFFNSNQASIEEARTLLLRLKEDAETVREMIVEEMRNRYGFVWKLYMGFHAIQSMEYVSLYFWLCHIADSSPIVSFAPLYLCVLLWVYLATFTYTSFLRTFVHALWKQRNIITRFTPS